MQVWNLQLPVIAAVHGYCLGGGFELALHCDFILAADDATFGYPPARAGLPDTQMFAYRLGTQWAKRLLYTGDSIDSQTAERIGLALNVVPRAQLDDESLALARAIAQVPSAFVQGAKRVLNASVERLGLEATATQSHYEFAIGMQSGEVTEFSRIAREQGTAAAIAWRDGRNA
jgi:enoyl-CoA hydratase